MIRWYVYASYRQQGSGPDLDDAVIAYVGNNNKLMPNFKEAILFTGFKEAVESAKAARPRISGMLSYQPGFTMVVSTVAVTINPILGVII